MRPENPGGILLSRNRWNKIASMANVIDYFKTTETIVIKGMLNEHRRPLIVAFEGFQNDFNFSTVIRNANAFLVGEVIGLGGTSKWYDRRGTVGTHHYENIKFIPDLNEFKNRLIDEKIHLVVMEDSPESVDLPSYQWNEKSCLLVGAEAVGVSQEVVNWIRNGEVSGDIVYIPQYGSVRSLNAGVAAGLAMYDYSAKMNHPTPPWSNKKV
jgi:tRNA G18 (ribose-2'-O)-methylase SpoU